MSIFGTDGNVDIRVDLVGFLANTLRGYEATSILREQLQNADDACHKQQRPGELALEFREDRLIVTNPSIFDDADWARITTPASRGKFTDSEQTGEFGIGFWGSLHLTDSPIITSGSLEVTLHPSGRVVHREVPSVDGTRFEFPYRRVETDVGRDLDVGVIDGAVERQMVDMFIDQMAELLLFTRAIETITLTLQDGTQRRASRTVRSLRPQVDLLSVDVAGAPEQNCRHLVVRTEIPDPPPHRHGHVAVALPIVAPKSSRQVFVTFPTETTTALNLSINAHFRATDDRRSLENAGQHGEWNARIFETAGQAVGSVLETLLNQDLTGVDYDTAVRWFVHDRQVYGDISERAQRFISALDEEARQRVIAPDTSGTLRRSDELANLEPQIETIVGQYVGETLEPGHPGDVLAVLRRWGLRRWGPTEVAQWLARNLPKQPTKRSDSPAYLHELENALTLIRYCDSAAHLLADSALLRAENEDVYYAVRNVHRATQAMQHLAEGLELPLAQRRFANTALGQMAPPTDAKWLAMALRRSTDQLVGKRVPIRSIGVASEHSHIQEALGLLRRGNQLLEGLPLAMDESGVLQVFADATVCGLPQGPGRKTIAALCRRLGLVPVHFKIDDELLEPEVQRFSLSIVVEHLQQDGTWDPIDDSRLLVEAVAELHRDRDVSPTLIARLRDAPIWAASDGTPRSLHELRLPPRTLIGTPSLPLLHLRLVGDIDPSAAVYATFHGLFGVDVLDSTEEFVLECETPPEDLDARRALLEALGDLERFSDSQVGRLKNASFVLCRDRTLRRPSQVLLTGDELPLSLGDRRVDDLGLERRARKHLESFGASPLPRAADLSAVATEIAGTDASLEPDPGLALWEFLRLNYSDYSQADFADLSEVAWLRSDPGPARRAPKECLDPQFSFAAMVYPVPTGVRSPPGELRDKLRMKPNLDAADYVRIGEYSAEHDRPLTERFFESANLRATEGSNFEAVIASLRSRPIVPLPDGLHAPERLVPVSEAQVWGRLRRQAPSGFVTEFRNLARAWRMADDEDPDWHVHLEVLKEIATLAAPDDEDLKLARQRLESLAGFDLGDHEVETIRRHAVVPTSLGLSAVAEALRGDLPPMALNRLKSFVPVADEWDRVTPLLDALQLPGLRSKVRFKSIAESPTTDDRWQRILSTHSANLLRFLKGSNAHLDETMTLNWPPTVVSVKQLSVQALIDGQMVDEWRSEAHLATDGGSPTLYVSAVELNHRSVVDAISTEFDIDQARKNLLLAVLRAETTRDGAAELDWAMLPQLSPTESEYVHVHVHEETEVVFGEESSDYPAPNADQTIPANARNDTDRAEAEPTAEQAPEAPGQPAAQTLSSNDAGQPDDDQATQDDPVDFYERAQSPRGATDVAQLEREGISTTYDLDDEVEDTDYQPKSEDGNDEPRDEARVCLSYYDVLHGMLPIDGRQLSRLTTGVALQHVLLFGEQIPARQAGSRHVQLEDGAMIFASREVVPGTIIRLYPSEPGTIEAVLRPEPHSVSGVWMLQLDDNGNLERLHHDDLELQWETDDAFYRSERRLEDIEALMLDGGKSAIQLIIEVLLNHPDEGLTSEEVWGLVAVNRLFAKATIAAHLSQQTGMFEQRDGRWYMVGKELRRRRRISSNGRSTSSGRPTRATVNQEDEMLRIARKLVRLIESADRSTMRRVRSILDGSSRLTDRGHGEE